MGHQTSAAIRRRKPARAATRPVVADGEGRVIARLASGPVVATLAGPVRLDGDAGCSRASVLVCGAPCRWQRVETYSAASMATPRKGEGNQQGGRKASGKGARHGEG